MCTVTVVTTPGGSIRLVCNRDERRSRARCAPPIERRCGERLAAMPIDPESGGTWVGVNDAALAGCILNMNRAWTAPSATAPSRGLILPVALGASDLAEALDAAATQSSRSIPPFTLLLLDADRWATLGWDGMSLTATEPSPFTGPILLTSSSLGDDLVERPRRELFERTLAAAPAAEIAAAQDAFHAHRWPEAPHLSVAMCRRDARTMSRTSVTLGTDEAGLGFQRLDDDLNNDGPPVSVRLAWRTRTAIP